jgi:hypothetical protein
MFKYKEFERVRKDEGKAEKIILCEDCKEEACGEFTLNTGEVHNLCAECMKKYQVWAFQPIPKREI